MMTRSFRLFALTLCAALPLAAGPTATRVCSVYVESYAALQKQLFQGAEIFKSPQLGALPMMLTLSLPGAAQINHEQPLALHLFDTGAGKAGFVLEVTPAGAPEAYLQAIIGNEAELPKAVGGVYAFPGGAARVVGARILLSPQAADLAACTGGDAAPLPPLPAIPGTIRVSVAPASMKPMFESFKKKIADIPSSGMPNAGQTRQSLEAVVDFYSLLLGQIDLLEIGIAVQTQGLAFHTRMRPVKGSDIAAMVASAKPAAPEHLAFIEKDTLFGLASGPFTLPDATRKQFIGLYTRILRLTPNLATLDPAGIAAIMEQSLRVLGTPLACSVSRSPETLLVQGVLTLPNAETYLNEQRAMMTNPVCLAIMKQSGMKAVEPAVRSYKKVNIHTYKILFDEEAFKAILREQLPTNAPQELVQASLENGLKPLRAMRGFFGSGYEYAATGKNLAFGMGAPARIEAVIDRLGAPARAPAEAARILAALAPPTAPCAVGRLSCAGFFQMMLAMSGSLPPATTAELPPGEGAIFTKWVDNGDVRSTFLVPPSEVAALKATTAAIAQSRRAMNAQELEETDEDGADEDGADEDGANEDEPDGNEAN